MNEKPTNGDEPATRHELSLLAGELTGRLDSIEERMATKDDLAALEERMATKDDVADLSRQLGQILKVVESNAGRAKETEDHEERLTRLEDKVDAIQLKI